MIFRNSSKMCMLIAYFYIIKTKFNSNRNNKPTELIKIPTMLNINSKVGSINNPYRQPTEKRIAQAIIDLENEIEGGVLPTSKITSQVNKGYPKKFQISSSSVGKNCSSKLGLRVPCPADNSISKFSARLYFIFAK